MTNDQARQLREVIRKETRPLRELIEANQTEMRAEFAAVRAEMAAASGETRRHFDVLTEDLRGGIKLLAEGHAALGEKIDSVDRKVTRVEGRVEALDLRVMWLQDRTTSLEVGQRAVAAAVRELTEHE
jgi:uncharacterized protein (DUF3084 family)